MDLVKEWADKDMESSFKVLPEGIYDFSVMAGEDKFSHANNEMWKVTLKIFDGQGGHIQIFDYLVKTEKAYFKISQFCKATGLHDRLKAGDTISGKELKGLSGQLKLAIEKDETYGEQNRVKGYVVLDNQGTAPAQPLKVHEPTREMPPENSDIPFQVDVVPAVGREYKKRADVQQLGQRFF